MNANHMKLVGGSLNTAKHDAERIRSAREEVKRRTDEEKDRAQARRFRGMWDDGL